MLLRITRRLINSERRIDTLTETDANATLAITNDDNEAEVEAATTCHNTSDTACIDCNLIELATLTWWTRASTPAAGCMRGTSANRSACTRACRRSDDSFYGLCDNRRSWRLSNAFHGFLNYFLFWCHSHDIKM